MSKVTWEWVQSFQKFFLQAALPRKEFGEGAVGPVRKVAFLAVQPRVLRIESTAWGNMILKLPLNL